MVGSIRGAGRVLKRQRRLSGGRGIGGRQRVRLPATLRSERGIDHGRRPLRDPVSHLLAADSVRPFRSCREWCHRKDHHRWRPALVRW